MPVPRIRVIWLHTGLHEVFQFDFTDDVNAFTDSSDAFNKIIASVPFLG